MEIAFPRLVFGEKHRYGTPAGGGPAEVKAFTLDDLRTFHQQPTTVRRTRRCWSSAMSRRRPSCRCSSAHSDRGRRPGAAGPTAAIPAAPQLTKRQIYLIDKPGAAQSQIRIGWVGVPRSTPDYPTIQVLNTILGGSFTSRLNTNLRETHGYSYGAFSSFEERISPGPFSARAGVQTDKTAEALKEFFNELTGHPEAGPGRGARQGEELRRARFPGGVRDAPATSRRRWRSRSSTACPTSTFRATSGRSCRSTGAGRREGRGALHSAGQVRGGDRRRSQDDRSRASAR